jgi:hypothetical protein
VTEVSADARRSLHSQFLEIAAAPRAPPRFRMQPFSFDADAHFRAAVHHEVAAAQAEAQRAHDDHAEAAQRAVDASKDLARAYAALPDAPTDAGAEVTAEALAAYHAAADAATEARARHYVRVRLAEFAAQLERRVRAAARPAALPTH